MSASDEFTKLKEQVENADRSIKAAMADDDAKLKAKVDEVRKKADDREAELRAKSADTGGQADRHWDEVKRDWDKHIQRMGKHAAGRKAAAGRTVASQ